MIRKRDLLLALLMVFVLVACGGGGGDEEPTQEQTGDVAHGQELFVATCAACHGPNGEGIQGLGKPFAGSEFLKNTDDAGLVALIKEGRPADDPANTTGVAMPPQGGNPALTEGDLHDIVAFLRTLQ